MARRQGQHRWRIGLVAIAASLSLAACGLGDNDDPAATLVPTSEPTIPPTSAVQTPLEVAPPVWTTAIDPADGSPVDTIEWFPTDGEVIYAAFETSAIAAGTTFSVSWVMNGAPVPGLNPSLEMRADVPPGWIEFHLERTSAAPWPDGVLEVRLSVAGEVVSSGEIELRDP